MYIYKIGYFSYEESPHRYLTHEVLFTQEEFDQLIGGALVALVTEQLSRPIPEYFPIRIFSDLFPDLLADFLIRDKGFSELKIAASNSVFGWSSVHPSLTGSSSFSSEADSSPPTLAASIRLAESNLIPVIVEKNLEFDRWIDAHGI